MPRVLFAGAIAITLAISCGTQPAALREAEPSSAAGSAPITTSTAAPTNVTTTAAPTIALTVAPTVAQAARPVTAAPTTNLCGAPTSPWNYTFCGGTYITIPPSNFCSYFNCIASFAGGRGYVIQCADRTFSKSGGISGSCSQHGGNYHALYAP